jgi:hypothetical protein
MVMVNEFSTRSVQYILDKVGFSDQNFPTIIQISSEILKMVAGKLRRLVPSNTLVRKRSESGGKQATHLALAAGSLLGGTGWPAGGSLGWPAGGHSLRLSHQCQCLPACATAAANHASS